MRLLSILFVFAIFFAGAPEIQAQPCASDSPTPGVGVVREAYDLISSRFVEPVPSSTLLPAGASAVVAEVRKSRPTADLAEPESWFAGDPGFSWGRFAERYCLAWEARGETLTPENLAYATIRAMAASVSEAHTGFLTPEQYRDHVAWTSTGEVRYEGIGIRLRNEPLRIDYVFAGGPAEAAGLRAGDEILVINGTQSREMTSAAAAIALRGEAGSRVRLTVRRPDVPAPWEVDLTRARISIPSTESRVIDQVGYLNIRGFPRPALFDEVASELAWLNAVGAQALVLDLRGNAGGRLDVGSNVAGLFLPDAAPLYRETTRVGQVTRRSVPSQALWTKPLVVLIDEGTASMGEILAAAIQEQKVAQVIGMRTAGAVAGSLVLPLSDGSAVQVTVVRIDSGLGQVLNNIGVRPDIEMRTAPAPARNDEPLDAAVGMLRARIGPPQTATAPAPTSSPSPTSSPPATSVPSPTLIPTPAATPTAS